MALAWTPFTFATTYSLLADLVTDLVVLASRWGLMGAYGRPCRFRQLSRASIVALQFWHLAGFALRIETLINLCASEHGVTGTRPRSRIG